MAYLLQHSNFHVSTDLLANSIRSGAAIAVTDASVKVTKRTSSVAWIITDRLRSFTVEGVSGCPKFHAAIDSYSAELFGILIILLVCHHTCEYFNIDKGSLTIACDNDASLRQAIESVTRAKVSDPFFNLLWAAHEFRDSFNIKFRAKQVKGHQDSLKKRSLNFYERLNVAMVANAKQF